MDTVKVNNKNHILDPANIGDAGYDVIAASDPKIVGLKVDGIDAYHAIDYIEYDTDLIIEPPKNYHTYIFPRSSQSNKNLILCNSVGLIDNEYRGTIKLRFKYIAQPIDLVMVNGIKLAIAINGNKIYKKGDKIGQLVFSNTLRPEIAVVESFEETSRNEGGFGSTGS